jgi:hypothetical protein
MADSTRKLSDEQARALWRRAAELQAAAEQAVTQSRALAPTEEGSLSLEQVAAAAEGAGIEGDYLRIAVAEQRLPDADDLGHETWKARWLERLIHEPHSMEAQRIIAADPQTVLSVFRTLAASDRFPLTFENVVGDDPVADAVLVYRVEGTAGSFAGQLNLADGRVLLVTIRPHDAGTRMHIRVPLFRRGVNLLVTGGSAGIFGGGGAGLAGGIATSFGGGVAIAALPVAAGLFAGGALGVAAIRRLHRWSRRQGSTAVEQLLQAVALEAEGRRSRLTG